MFEQSVVCSRVGRPQKVRVVSAGRAPWKLALLRSMSRAAENFVTWDRAYSLFPLFLVDGGESVSGAVQRTEVS